MRLFTAIILLACGVASHAATVTGVLQDTFLDPVASKIIRFTPRKTLIQGNNVYLDSARSVTAGTNGAFSVRLYGGWYDVDAGGTQRIPILVPIGSTNTLTFDVVAGVAANAAMFPMENFSINYYEGGTNASGGTVDTAAVIALAQVVIATNPVPAANISGTVASAATASFSSLAASAQAVDLANVGNKGTLSDWSKLSTNVVSTLNTNIVRSLASQVVVTSTIPAANVSGKVATATAADTAAALSLSGSTNLLVLTNDNGASFVIGPDGKIGTNVWDATALSLLTLGGSGDSWTLPPSPFGNLLEVVNPNTGNLVGGFSYAQLFGNGGGLYGLPASAVDGLVEFMSTGGTGTGGGVAYAVSNRVSSSTGRTVLATIPISTNQVKGVRLLVIGLNTGGTNLVQVLNVSIARNTGDPVVTDVNPAGTGGEDYTDEIAAVQAQIDGLDTTYATDAAMATALAGKMATNGPISLGVANMIRLGQYQIGDLSDGLHIMDDSYPTGDLTFYAGVLRGNGSGLTDLNWEAMPSEVTLDTELSAGLAGKLDTNGTIGIGQVSGLYDELSEHSTILAGLMYDVPRKAGTNQLASATNSLAAAIAATYQPLLANPLTNGHTSPITINTDVEINGNFTVNSTNATTTVSNLVVGGTITGEGANTLSNEVYAASKTLTEASTNITVLKVNSNNIVGVIPIANLGTGTPDGTKFLRDDGTLATPASGTGGSSMYAAQTFEAWDDMFSASPSGAQAGPIPLRWITSSGAFAAGTGDDAHPGQVILGTSTATTSYTYGTTAPEAFLLSSGSWTNEFIFSIPTVSDNTEHFTIRGGFMDSQSASLAVDGVLWAYSHTTNSGKLHFLTSSNSVRSTVDSGLTIEANTWYKIKTAVSGGTAYFFTNGVLAGSLTDNVPTGAGRSTGLRIEILKQAGTTERTVALDAAYLGFRLAAPR